MELNESGSEAVECTLDLESTEGLENTAEWKGIIEAILFTMGESVPLEKLAAVLEIDKEKAKAIITQMMSDYEKENHGIQIIELDGAYQMCTKKQMYEYLIKIARQPKKQVLTDVLLETLSIIAYKQPVTRMEIEKIRSARLAGWTYLADHCCLEQQKNFCAASASILLKSCRSLSRSRWRNLDTKRKRNWKYG